MSKFYKVIDMGVFGAAQFVLPALATFIFISSLSSEDALVVALVYFWAGILSIVIDLNFSTLGFRRFSKSAKKLRDCFVLLRLIVYSLVSLCVLIYFDTYFAALLITHLLSAVVLSPAILNFSTGRKLDYILALYRVPSLFYAFLCYYHILDSKFYVWFFLAAIGPLLVFTLNAGSFSFHISYRLSFRMLRFVLINNPFLFLNSAITILTTSSFSGLLYYFGYSAQIIRDTLLVERVVSLSRFPLSWLFQRSLSSLRDYLVSCLSLFCASICGVSLLIFIAKVEITSVDLLLIWGILLSNFLAFLVFYRTFNFKGFRKIMPVSKLLVSVELLVLLYFNLLPLAVLLATELSYITVGWILYKYSRR